MRKNPRAVLRNSNRTRRGRAVMHDARPSLFIFAVLSAVLLSGFTDTGCDTRNWSDDYCTKTRTRTHNHNHNARTSLTILTLKPKVTNRPEVLTETRMV